MEDRTRRYACLAIGVGLILTGTFATGLLPSTTLYQVFAGGIIVLGFAVVWACLGSLDVE
ncbi:hypothetical protein BRD00_14145 [Halobacteriales archaeon QS_8_69_26]|nr:MAG: hypothetical protein BRD00_14145 [Halobacteriales archaeon QS_8_69_26]